MKQKRKKIAGFSLIEVLFAMIFLSVIIFGVIKLQTSNLTLSNTQQNELKAHFYASQALEIAEAIGWVVISACGGDYCTLNEAGDVYSLLPLGSETLDDGLFSRTIEHDETDLTDASLVTAKVEWIDSSGDHLVTSKRIIFL